MLKEIWTMSGVARPKHSKLICRNYFSRMAFIINLSIFNYKLLFSVDY